MTDECGDELVVVGSIGTYEIGRCEKVVGHKLPHQLLTTDVAGRTVMVTWQGDQVRVSPPIKRG